MSSFSVVTSPPGYAPWIIDDHTSDDIHFGGFNISSGEGPSRIRLEEVGLEWVCWSRL